jgi:hypothetical protein
MRSVPDTFGRSGDAVITQAANLTGYYGPFAPPTIWGDAAANMFIDPATVIGTASIAVVSF